MARREKSKEPEKLAFIRAGVLLVNFIKKPTKTKQRKNNQLWTRAEMAEILGVHHNSIYQDELVLEQWCDHYNSKMRRVRLDLYQVWLILFTRCLVNEVGRKQTGNFLFNYPEKLSHEQFTKLKEEIIASYASNPKIKRVFAA